MSIVRELKFAERATQSGRDLEDQDIAEFKFKKLQEGKRREFRIVSLKEIRAHLV